MRNCFCDGVYGSGVWTAGIKADFDYRNNVIANGNYAWTYQGGASALADAGGRGGRQGGVSAPSAPRELVRYKVIDSYFANNRRIAMKGTKVTAEPVSLERDQTKRNYLHPVAGTEAAKVGAGLFLKP
jgi:hypothetical protein